MSPRARPTHSPWQYFLGSTTKVILGSYTNIITYLIHKGLLHTYNILKCALSINYEDYT